MNFNTLPEEQDNLELINRLQDFHRLTPEDRKSLASVEKRLFTVAPSQPSHLDEHTPGEPVELFPSRPVFPEHPRMQKVWQRRLELYAAVAGVVLILGASLLAFLFIQGKNHAAVDGKTPVPTHSTRTVQPTDTVQPTSTTPLPLVPGEKRTLVGSGTQLGYSMPFIATAQVSWAMQGPPEKNAGPILRTTDGGKHWQKVAVPQKQPWQISEFYVFDESMAFNVSQPGGKQASGQLSLYRTLDGGATWQRSTLPAFASNNGSEIGFSWSFLDHQQGWMTMFYRACCGGDDRRKPLDKSGDDMLYHTTDGGLTWVPVVSLPLKYRAQNLTFINDQTGWLTSYVDDPAHTALDDPLAFPSVLYMTHDGGYTWQQQSLPSPDLKTFKPFYSLTFFSANKGYLFNQVSTPERSDQGFLYETQDGGNSWHLINSPITAYRLDIVNDSYVVNETTLFTLRDGQWVAVSKPFPFSSSTVTARFFSSLAGLALTDTGEVYQTGDGGQSWQRVGALPTE